MGSSGRQMKTPAKRVQRTYDRSRGVLDSESVEAYLNGVKAPLRDRRSGKEGSVADNEYTFQIDVFTPDTIPMARLAQYMAALADLVGFKESTHFVRLDEGSARLVSKVEQPDRPKVDRRLATIAGGFAPPDGRRAFQAIDDMLADDNATGLFTSPGGAVVLPFPGRTRPQPLTFPAFRQDGSIDGVVVSVGGRDRTAHVILQDGKVTYTKIELSRETARELAKHLYGPKVRLFGSGRWQRLPDGAWELLKFTVSGYEMLDDTPLSVLLNEIRAIPGNELMGDHEAYERLMSLRRDEGDVH